ncbi:cytochrome P450 [Actinomadura madurae]|nr:cytochrome P450 [Actinomadura madurae]
MPTAVEEFLRWASPVYHFRRTATRDVEMRGKRIREGDKVVLWFASGNRDEDVFADPYRFDVTRSPNDHVTFGKGSPHFCLGNALARLEMCIMFEELLPRLAGIRRRGRPAGCAPTSSTASRRCRSPSPSPDRPARAAGGSLPRTGDLPLNRLGPYGLGVRTVVRGRRKGQ